VDFLLDRTLCRAPWRADSKARIIARFPESPAACDWWFNPDSACWQFATARVDLDIPAPGEPGARACRSELWQSSRDGLRWRFVRADTATADMDECGLSEGLASRIRREPRVTPWDFAPALSGSPRASDSDPSRDDEAGANEWQRIHAPLATAPGMEVEMFDRSFSTEWSVAGPAWLVNRSDGSRRVLCATPPGSENCGEHGSLEIREACGLLLVEFCPDDARVVDVRTGEVSECLPKSAMRIVVAPRLRR
jgi:hypothetical protein